MLNQNSSIKAARAYPTLSSLEDRESRTGKRNVRLPRHFHKTILAKQQWNSKTRALNPSKLLTSQLLLKSLFYRSPLTLLPRGQPSSGAGWPRVRAVSIWGGFQHPTGQSPAKPCLTSEWPRFQPKTGAETSGAPSQPELSYYPTRFMPVSEAFGFFSVANSLGAMPFSCWQAK